MKQCYVLLTFWLRQDHELCGLYLDMPLQSTAHADALWAPEPAGSSYGGWVEAEGDTDSDRFVDVVVDVLWDMGLHR